MDPELERVLRGLDEAVEFAKSYKNVRLIPRKP
jgi:hypothetical protein